MRFALKKKGLLSDLKISDFGGKGVFFSSRTRQKAVFLKRGYKYGCTS